MSLEAGSNRIDEEGGRPGDLFAALEDERVSREESGRDLGERVVESWR